MSDRVVILVINNAIAQIAIQIKSSPPVAGFNVVRLVYYVSSVIQDFVFLSRKKGCIRCISVQVYNQ